MEQTYLMRSFLNIYLWILYFKVRRIKFSSLKVCIQTSETRSDAIWSVIGMYELCVCRSKTRLTFLLRKLAKLRMNLFLTREYWETLIYCSILEILVVPGWEIFSTGSSSQLWTIEHQWGLTHREWLLSCHYIIN